ncbi:hypothetical protein GGI35DRAFT_464047 [Trichoderma velutinum]
MDSCKRSAGNSRNERGRPRRDGDCVSEAIKIRREQNRKAQQTLKARRLAAQAETENRIALLEKTIESMAELFLNMTDKVMSLAPIRQNSDLSRHIRDSIVQYLSLVRDGITKDRERGKSKDLVSSQTQDSSRHAVEPSTADFNRIEAISDSNTPLLRDKNNSRDTERLAFVPEPALGKCLDTEHPLSSNTFGPRRIGNALHPSSSLYSIRLHSKLSPSSVSIELVRCTLNFAYHVLHDAVDLSTGLAAQMFGLSLQDHSREQLLSKLLWTLGPGSSVLEDFASVDTMTSSQGSEISDHFQAFDIVSYSSDSSLINAEGVVSWLDSIGVRRIDEDTLEIPISGQATPPDIGGVISGFSRSRYSFLNANTFFSPTQSAIRKGLPDLTKVSMAYTTRVSQSALFHQLSQVSVCLSSGLAYYQQHLVKAVLASQIYKV